MGWRHIRFRGVGLEVGAGGDLFICSAVVWPERETEAAGRRKKGAQGLSVFLPYRFVTITKQPENNPPGTEALALSALPGADTRVYSSRVLHVPALIGAVMCMKGGQVRVILKHALGYGYASTLEASPAGCQGS